MSDPVPPPPVTPPYCTVVPGRTPGTKTHTSLGHAKNAVAVPTYAGGHRDGDAGHYCYGVRGGQLYEWNGTEWAVLHDVTPNSPECELPWRQPAPSNTTEVPA